MQWCNRGQNLHINLYAVEFLEKPTGIESILRYMPSVHMQVNYNYNS